MNINEVLAIVERQCSGAERKEEIRHLSLLEKRIINEVLSNYPEAVYDRNFAGYTPDTDGSEVLLAESPYDQMYVHYLLAQHYLLMLEQGHYNIQINLFNSLYDDYKIFCARNMRADTKNNRYRVR